MPSPFCRLPSVLLTAAALGAALSGSVRAAPRAWQAGALPFPAPSSPGGLAALPLGPCRVLLTWQDNSSEETHFQIERRQGGSAFSAIGSAPASSTTFLDTSALAGGDHDYRVLAFRHIVGSRPSNVVSVLTPSGAAPIVTVDLAPGSRVGVGRELRFSVHATDPDGDRVSLVLLNPPPGMVFDPLKDAPSPSAAEARWLVQVVSTGRHELVFEARDDACPERTSRATVAVQVEGSGGSGQLCGDVTGDGIPDVVASASATDVFGLVADAGAVHVWAGGRAGEQAPTATLLAPEPRAGDQLGLAAGIHSFDSRGFGQGVQLADVTGDSVLDVIVAAPLADVGGAEDAGAVYVWAGGASLTAQPAPTAVLTNPSPMAGDRLGVTASGDVNGQAVVVGDVIGDGCLDVVVAASGADIGGVSDAGVLFVWAGGLALAGTPAPGATLAAASPSAGDALGVARGQGVQLADVTGDGRIDVVVTASLADQQSGGTVFDAGAIHVWAGGAALSGSVTPVASLWVPAAGFYDRLGFAGRQGTHIADLTGDGQPDVIAGSLEADAGGAFDAGAIYLWAGGPSLSGILAPTATLAAPGSFLLGQTASGQGLELADVSGDSIADVVAPCPSATVSGVRSGAVYVWLGGSSLTGAQSPSGVLSIPGGMTDDQLGHTGGTDGLLVLDLTGDGVRDVVAGASAAAVGGVPGAGAVFVWSGGASISGIPLPTAVLTVPGGSSCLGCGNSLPGFFFDQNLSLIDHGLQAVDASGDGFLDLIASAPFDLTGGAVYVWNGGPALAGSPAPSATLSVPGASSLDRLGLASGQGIQLADVTGDGVADIVGVTGPVYSGAIPSAIHVWSGGAGLAGPVAPTATLAADAVGRASGQSVQLVDLTGDGVLDIASSAMLADGGSAFDAGRIYLWKGGISLAGSLGPMATLAVPGAVSGDRLGQVKTGQGVLLVDVSGDGLLDIVAGQSRADIRGVVDAGAVRIWFGHAGMSGTRAPSADLTATWARPGDELCR